MTHHRGALPQTPTRGLHLQVFGIQRLRNGEGCNATLRAASRMI